MSKAKKKHSLVLHPTKEEEQDVRKGPHATLCHLLRNDWNPTEMDFKETGMKYESHDTKALQKLIRHPESGFKTQRKLLFGAIMSGRTALLKRLCEAGADVNIAWRFNETQGLQAGKARNAAWNIMTLKKLHKATFSYLTFAGALFDSGYSKNALESIQILTIYADMNTSVIFLKGFIHNVVAPFEYLKEIAFNIVSRSQFPIIACLDIAHVFKEASETNLLENQDFMTLHEVFSRYALSLLHSIKSAHLASVALEVRDANKRCAFDVALDNNNLIFIGDGHISMILNTIFFVPYFMTKSSFGISERTYQRSHQLLYYDPRGLFLLPWVQLTLNNCGFALLLILFTTIITFRIGITRGPNGAEIALWIVVFGFIVEEAFQVISNGLAGYWKSGWNKIDISVYMLFIITFISRVASPWGDSVDEPATIIWQQVFDCTLAGISFLLWSRLTFLFTLNKTLGPLLRMLTRFIDDLVNFAFLLFVIMIGFAFAFTLLVGKEQTEEYGSVWASIFTLYQATLGNFTFLQPGSLSLLERTTANFLLALYLLMCMVVLLNLLIAMMSTTYENVKENSRLEYMFARASAIWERDQRPAIFPAPLNLVVLSLTPLLVLSTPLRKLWLAVKQKRASKSITRSSRKQKTAESVGLKSILKSPDSFVTGPFTSWFRANPQKEEIELSMSKSFDQPSPLEGVEIVSTDKETEKANSRHSDSSKYKESYLAPIDPAIQPGSTESRMLATLKVKVEVPADTPENGPSDHLNGSSDTPDIAGNSNETILDQPTPQPNLTKQKSFSQWHCRYCTMLNKERNLKTNSRIVEEIISRRAPEVAAGPHFRDLIDTHMYIPCTTCWRHQKRMKGFELFWVNVSFFLFKFLFLFPTQICAAIPVFVFSRGKILFYQLIHDFFQSDIAYTRRRTGVNPEVMKLFEEYASERQNAKEEN